MKKSREKIKLGKPVLSKTCRKSALLTVVYMSVFALFACNKNSHVDSVKKFVNQVAEKSVPPLKPIPELKSHEQFTYPEHNRNPFLPTPKVQGVSQGPDQNRQKQALESFAFDSLHMVGTVMENNQVWALIKAPDSSIYRVKAGNYLGENFGKVTEITSKTIKVLETVQVGDAWKSRVATIALSQEQEK